MALVAFSNVAVDWSRVFAAMESPTAARGIAAVVVLLADLPGSGVIEIRLVGKDAQSAVAKLANPSMAMRGLN